MPIKAYKHSAFIKRGLVFLAILIILSTIIYTQRLVNQLRDESTKLVKFYAETFVKATTEYETGDFSFIFEEIIKKMSFPMIISKEKNSRPINWVRLDIDRDSTSAADTSEIISIMSKMDEANEPIPLEYKDTNLGYIHYGDTKLIRRLELLPYIEITMVAVFIFLGYLGFHFIRSSEKQSIWVGMAKETAHQLGTPLSSLMGWIEVIKDEVDNQEYIKEMSKDLNRLKKIANRFSKIGSKPKLEKKPIKPIIKSAIDYYKKRLPQLGHTVKLTYDIEDELEIPVNSDLFSWAIENMVKNSIDASRDGEAFVKVKATRKDKKAIIDIIDNGKGIAKKNWKNIFRPGYSSKRRGWGLGLSLTKRIIENYHNGKVFVKSSKPNKKTVIRITI